MKTRERRTARMRPKESIARDPASPAPAMEHKATITAVFQMSSKCGSGYNFLISRLALWPPKPKEFEAAQVIFMGRGTFGT